VWSFGGGAITVTVASSSSLFTILSSAHARQDPAIGGRLQKAGIIAGSILLRKNNFETRSALKNTKGKRCGVA
jgi:hypothetical protein